MLFYLGIHQPQWLEETDVPTFVSRRRFALRCRRRLPKARGPWALDSGAFSEIAEFGEWRLSALQYAHEARRLQSEVGNMQWAAIQDWMCEPFMLAKTGLSVEQHQERTVWSLITLRSLAPDVPWAPVLQGWAPADYLRHRDLYEAHGVPLEREKIVGVGSVCRRGHTEEIQTLASELVGLQLHGFGVKTRAVETAARYFTSTDSMAWSFRARHAPPLPGCDHPRCGNCLRFALQWRERLLQKLSEAGS